MKKTEELIEYFFLFINSQQCIILKKKIMQWIDTRNQKVNRTLNNYPLKVNI